MTYLVHHCVLLADGVVLGHHSRVEALVAGPPHLDGGPHCAIAVHGNLSARVATQGSCAHALRQAVVAALALRNRGWGTLVEALQLQPHSTSVARRELPRTPTVFMHMRQLPQRCLRSTAAAAEAARVLRMRSASTQLREFLTSTEALASCTWSTDAAHVCQEQHATSSGCCFR